MCDKINRTINTVEIKLNGKTIGTYINVNFVNTSLHQKKIDYNKVSYHYGTLSEKQDEKMFWKLIREGKVEKTR